MFEFETAPQQRLLMYFNTTAVLADRPSQCHAIQKSYMVKSGYAISPLSVVIVVIIVVVVIVVIVVRIIICVVVGIIIVGV